MDHILIPDAFKLTARRLPGGSIVLRQSGDTQEHYIIIPPDYVKAVCQGIFDVAMEVVAHGAD
jgi:hypothetical protein